MSIENGSYPRARALYPYVGRSAEESRVQRQVRVPQGPGVVPQLPQHLAGQVRDQHLVHRAERLLVCADELQQHVRQRPALWGGRGVVGRRWEKAESGVWVGGEICLR